MAGSTPVRLGPLAVFVYLWFGLHACGGNDISAFHPLHHGLRGVGESGPSPAGKVLILRHFTQLGSQSVHYSSSLDEFALIKCETNALGHALGCHSSPSTPETDSAGETRKAPFQPDQLWVEIVFHRIMEKISSFSARRRSLAG